MFGLQWHWLGVILRVRTEAETYAVLVTMVFFVTMIFTCLLILAITHDMVEQHKVKMEDVKQLSKILSPAQLRELANDIQKGRQLSQLGTLNMLDRSWVDDLRAFADELERLAK